MKWKVHLAEIEAGDKEKRAIGRVLESKWLTMGSRTLEFEQFGKKTVPHIHLLYPKLKNRQAQKTMKIRNAFSHN